MCITTFNEFVDKNTYFLSPYTLKKYLYSTNEFNITSDISENEINDYKEFILSLMGINNFEDMYLLLVEHEHWLDRVIKFTIASYESLGRLFIYLTKKYNDDKVVNKILKEMIENCKGKTNSLPSTSNSIKKNFEKCKGLIAYMISLMYFEELATFFKKNIKNGDLFNIMVEELKIRYEEPCKGFRKLIELIKNFRKEEIYITDLAIYLYHTYTLVSKGESKAFEGYSYEKILLDLIREKGIIAEGTSKLHNTEKDVGKYEKLCRNWDVYIPNKINPQIVIEVMYNVTTSSAMTNKVDKIEECVKKYPNLRIFVLVDGAGWIVRASDTKKLISNNKICVFTFHKESLSQFISKVRSLMY